MKQSGSLFFITRFTGLSIVFGFILRILLLFNHQTIDIPSFIEIIKAFILGSVYDFFFCFLALLPFFIQFLGWNELKYDKKAGIIIEILLLSALIYTFFFHSIFDQYGGGAPLIAKIFFSYKLFSFSLRFFIPKVRKTWRLISSQIIFFLYIFGLAVNTVSEYFFWNEFGVRYNFIAVDYLIYTTEVIGNIFESYPVVPMLIGLVLLSSIIQIVLQKKKVFVGNSRNAKECFAISAIMITGWVIGLPILAHSRTAFQSENTYVNELQSNGSYDFILAFKENKLDYQQFYPLLDKEKCLTTVQKLCNRNRQNIQEIRDSIPFVKKNIILITVESLSADYLSRYGNRMDLTPNLDSIMEHSLVFDSLYAVGNRTVRGLEALSLCNPPTTGESLIKRNDNDHLFSIGSLLSREGYSVQFLYGGNSYFDNMGQYFSNNGYKVIDKSSFKPDEITFSNIWGVCDEDTFGKALKIMDYDTQSENPAFINIMTVSNHRPFTFPSGKIKLHDEAEKSRDGAVKYTDYAIGRFIREAEQKAWFKNTIFIIVADHCSSSAGNTSIPVDQYHIPAIIYSPGFVMPRYVSKLCSQIDLMPTVLSLMHMSYDSRFVGQDILSPSFVPRAFLATYQNMSYLKNNVLTILSPVKMVKQYKVVFKHGNPTEEVPLAIRNSQLQNEAEALYQQANMYIYKQPKM